MKKNTKKYGENFEDLYVTLTNPEEKRKNLLYGIKNSLVMQDELEKLNNIRREKYTSLNDIKIKLNKLNASYQKLKRELPNIKNVLSYTEKELTVLDSQIDMLKKDVVADKGKINDNENIKERIKENKKIKIGNKPFVQEEKKIEKKKPLTRLDRIKNNLRVIESKLGNL